MNSFFSLRMIRRKLREARKQARRNDLSYRGRYVNLSVIYLRMLEAYNLEKGVRLTAHELATIVETDSAVEAAMSNMVEGAENE